MSNNEERRLTCKELLAKEYPEKIDPLTYGGCLGCPSDYGYLYKSEHRCKNLKVNVNRELCTKCWDQIANRYYKDKEEKNRVNLEDSLSKFIDEVNKNKDREVMIFIMKDSATVTSRPIEESPETCLFVDGIADRLLAIAKEDNLNARERFIEILESLIKDVKLNPDVKIIRRIETEKFTYYEE